MPKYVKIERRPPRPPDLHGIVRPYSDNDPDHPHGGTSISFLLVDGIDPDGNIRWYANLHCGLPFLEELHRQTGAFLAKEALRNRAPA